MSVGKSVRNAMLIKLYGNKVLNISTPRKDNGLAPSFLKAGGQSQHRITGVNFDKVWMDEIGDLSVNSDAWARMTMSPTLGGLRAPMAFRPICG